MICLSFLFILVIVQTMSLSFGLLLYKFREFRKEHLVSFSNTIHNFANPFLYHLRHFITTLSLL